MQSYSAVVLVLVIFGCLPVHSKWSSFECPPADQIHPCTCSTHPRKLVKCDDVKNLDIVRRALEHRFSNPLPTLEISNVHAFQLPHHAFRNISAKRLVLNGSNIRRIHDDAFDGQDSLGLLILSEDRLTDFPTEALKRLSGLRSLSLAGNFIMRITDQSIGVDSHLRVLILADNRLSHIERDSFPRSLESLSLSRNLLTTLNGTLNNIGQLEYFFAANNRLTFVRDEFKGLNQLRHLGLDGNNLSDIDGSFDDLTSLRTLNLAYNNLENVDDGLYPLKKLQNLNVSYNYITELDEDLFRSVNSIEVLDLSGNYITNICQAVKPLKLLRELRLSNMNLVALDYDCFKGMKNLQTIDVSQNDLANIDAVTAHSFPRLFFLHVQKNRLQSIRHGLKNLRNLYELDISENSIATFKSHHLMYNAQLRTFKIGGNPWDCTDHLLEMFRELETRGVQLSGAPLCYLDANAL